MLGINVFRTYRLPVLAAACGALTFALAACNDNAGTSGQATGQVAAERSDALLPQAARSQPLPQRQSQRQAGQPRISPLVEAVAHNDAARVISLLDAGASVNDRDERGLTPLHTAARTGRVEMIRLLLDRGADINARGDLNQTPILWAARQNQLEAVKLLVERGADFNLRGGIDDHHTPLSLAVSSNYVDIVDYLRSIGAQM